MSAVLMGNVCPLLSRGERTDCIGDKCALWAKGACAIRRIAENTDQLNYTQGFY